MANCSKVGSKIDLRMYGYMEIYINSTIYLKLLLCTTWRLFAYFLNEAFQTVAFEI